MVEFYVLNSDNINETISFKSFGNLKGKKNTGCTDTNTGISMGTAIYDRMTSNF